MDRPTVVFDASLAVTAFAKTSLTALRTIVPGRRRYVRHPQELLQSSLGPILDISLGGARLISHWPRTGLLQVELYGVEEKIIVQARVARCDRKAFFQYEVGLEFLNVSDSVGRKLTRLSTDYRVRPDLIAGYSAPSNL